VTNDADEFSIRLLEEAKRFLEKAEEAKEPEPYWHAALIIAFCSLESHLNAIADELADWDVSVLDQSVLLEREIRLDAGAWNLGDSRIFRTEDRIKFVMLRFGQVRAADYPWWSDLLEGTKARNGLVHPRSTVVVNQALVSRYMKAIVDGLNDIYLAVFKKGHPAFGRGLQSSASF
jgi:hypothetical protein